MYSYVQFNDRLAANQAKQVLAQRQVGDRKLRADSLHPVSWCVLSFTHIGIFLFFLLSLLCEIFCLYSLERVCLR